MGCARQQNHQVGNLPQPNGSKALREPVRQLEQVKGDARRGSPYGYGRGHAATCPGYFLIHPSF